MAPLDKRGSLHLCPQAPFFCLTSSAPLLSRTRLLFFTMFFPWDEQSAVEFVGALPGIFMRYCKLMASVAFLGCPTRNIE